ncbi:hypothetical protein LXL04_010224 [Taraxacum kok-saghyz]
MLRLPNSTPIVALYSRRNSFLENRDKRLVLPTPESPIITTLNITRALSKVIKQDLSELGRITRRKTSSNTGRRKTASRRRNTASRRRNNLASEEDSRRMSEI